MHKSINKGTSNPFKPGMGSKPAHFAGRKIEFHEINDSLQVLNEEKAKNNKLVENDPDPPIMLVGPRGVGKTTLLARSRNRAEELGIDCYTLLPEHFNHGFGGLIESLSIKNQALIENVLSRVKINYNDVIGIEYKPNNANKILEIVFETNLKKSGAMLLICDEAHEYDLIQFGIIANRIQYLMNNSYPLAVILAGTPELSTVVAKISASFMERVNDFNMNQLNTAETREAFEVPFKKYNIKFEKKALEKIVNSSDNFPFFIQLLGRNLWSYVYENNITTINLNAVNEAIISSSIRRRQFYRNREKEIKFSKYKSITLDTINYIKNNNNLTDLDSLQDFLAEKYSEYEYNEAIIYLLNKGVIWDNEDDMIVPGIPSFFNHILSTNKKSKSTQSNKKSKSKTKKNSKKKIN